jgi:hypothetical protein
LYNTNGTLTTPEKSVDTPATKSMDKETKESGTRNPIDKPVPKGTTKPDDEKIGGAVDGKANSADETGVKTPEKLLESNETDKVPNETDLDGTAPEKQIDSGSNGSDNTNGKEAKGTDGTGMIPEKPDNAKADGTLDGTGTAGVIPQIPSIDDKKTDSTNDTGSTKPTDEKPSDVTPGKGTDEKVPESNASPAINDAGTSNMEIDQDPVDEPTPTEQHPSPAKENGTPAEEKKQPSEEDAKTKDDKLVTPGATETPGERFGGEQTNGKEPSSETNRGSTPDTPSQEVPMDTDEETKTPKKPLESTPPAKRLKRSLDNVPSRYRQPAKRK